MEPAVTMTLADVFCQVRSSDELGDVRTLTASSRGPRPHYGLDRSPQQAESLATAVRPGYSNHALIVPRLTLRLRHEPAEVGVRFTPVGIPSTDTDHQPREAIDVFIG